VLAGCSRPPCRGDFSFQFCAQRHFGPERRLHRAAAERRRWASPPSHLDLHHRLPGLVSPGSATAELSPLASRLFARPGELYRRVMLYQKRRGTGWRSCSLLPLGRCRSAKSQIVCPLRSPRSRISGGGSVSPIGPHPPPARSLVFAPSHLHSGRRPTLAAADRPVWAIFHVSVCHPLVLVHTPLLAGRRLSVAVGPHNNARLVTPYYTDASDIPAREKLYTILGQPPSQPHH
jgi:hypothetical protein